MKFKYVLATAATLLALYACEETSTIGTSIIGDSLSIEIDSAYTVSGKTVEVEGVRSRTTDQILGNIDIPGYGRLSSNVVTQFLSTTALDTATFTANDIDSLVLMLRYNKGAFIGDSIAPMGLTVYPLTRQLPSPIYSDFDPKGYYDEANPMAAKVYNTSTLNSDSLRKLAYGYITMKLPLEFAKRIYNDYTSKPGSYADPKTFARDVFPGMYIAGTYGSGRMTVVSTTTMRMFLTTIKTDASTNTKDTISTIQDYYMVTPEVISNNNFTYTVAPSLKAMADEGKSLIVAPAAYETEITFPTRKIVDTYKNNSARLKVVNGLTFSIPVDTIKNGFGVSPPPYVLLVLKSDRDKFFADNALPDNIHSFYATYDATKMAYSFNNMQAYIREMIDKDEITEDDCVFRLVPVTVNFESISTSYYQQQLVESSVVPYVSAPAMADILLDKAKIKFTYSLENRK